MKPPRFHSRHAALLCASLLIFTMASCANFGKNRRGDRDGTGGGWDESSGTAPLPRRNENVSFSGPGSENVNRELFPAIYFAFDSSKIGASEMTKIDAVAQFLKTTGGRNSLIIGGFTDSIGSAEYNRQLGEFRALSVRAELIRRGIGPERVQTVSFGEDLPAAEGATASAQAANRRAEFGIIR